jgi:hypothetical protein
MTDLGEAVEAIIVLFFGAIMITVLGQALNEMGYFDFTAWAALFWIAAVVAVLVVVLGIGLSIGNSLGGGR